MQRLHSSNDYLKVVSILGTQENKNNQKQQRNSHKK